MAFSNRPKIPTQRKADARETAMTRGTHIPDGFPHISCRELCMCLWPCCNGPKGCKCKSCLCQILEQDHSTIIESRSILANTISSTGEDGNANGLPKRRENGGQNNNG